MSEENIEEYIQEHLGDDFDPDAFDEFLKENL